MKDTFKNIIKKFVKILFTWEARLVLWRYKPRLILITGSIGKTSTKEAVYTLFNSFFQTGKSQKSYNSDIGLPLAVLDLDTAWDSYWGWIKNLVKGFKKIIWSKTYPEWLVLEVGADRPRDISQLAEWLSAEIVIINPIPEIPPHIEFFNSRDHLVAEKHSLVKTLKPDGLLVYNEDNQDAKGAVALFSGQAKSFGLSEKADVAAHEVHVIYQEDNNLRWPVGTGFSVKMGGSTVPVRIMGVLGSGAVQSALAALAAGFGSGFNLVEMTESFSAYESPPGRMRLIWGIKNTLLIDDTYNSSPEALSSALNLLNKLEINGRKIAVLGDMLELGTETVNSHREAGKQAVGICDKLFAVGLRARFLAEAAIDAGMNPEEVKVFESSEKAARELQDLLEPGDVVLFKASQAIRMEKAVLELMKEPDKSKDLLCRQDGYWQEKPVALGLKLELKETKDLEKEK
ncbi:MAG: glutamate ligase domain-containing protein [Patescibacteria group bacterium]